MELEIQPAGRHCAVSGEPFVAGSVMVSFLHRMEDGRLERRDVSVGAVEGARFEGRLVCRWRHVVRPRGEAEAEARKRTLEGAEQVFLSLFEAPEADAPPMAEEERALLRLLLGLQLERKRVLRRLGAGRYWHSKLKQSFEIPETAVEPERLLALESFLAVLVEPPSA